MLGYSLTSDVPLGPFEGARVTLYAAGGKPAKLHAVRDCGYLRTREVGTLQVPLDASVVSRLCPRCADNGPQVRRETGLGIFLDALGGLGLLYQLGSHTGPEEDEEWNREEVEAAAALLRSPPADPGTDEEDDDAAEEAREVRDEAERIRDGVLSEWRRAATSLHQARRTVLSFAWLEQWAQPKLLMKEEYLAFLRGQAVLFVDVAGLATAAAVAVMDEPQLPAGDEAFKILGTTADITRGLRSLWGRWQRHVSDGWDQPAEHSWIAHSLVGSISSRRKGRDQVLAAAEALLATWAEHAHQVAVAGTVPDALLTVTLPEPLGEEPHRRGREWLDHLDTWELGVLVTFLTDADWARGVLTVRVPELIARRLLDRRSTLACTPHQSTPSSTVAEGTRSAPGADHPIGPGIFDDTPVADRRLVTITHLKALRAASGVADQLYLVFSTERGAEVLPLAALESRCEQGWQGIILAGASDLPGHLIERQKTTPANPLDDEPGQEHSTGRRHRDHQDPFFGQHLSTDHALQAMERQSYFDQDREHNLRSLAMARGVRRPAHTRRRPGLHRPSLRRCPGRCVGRPAGHVDPRPQTLPRPPRGPLEQRFGHSARHPRRRPDLHHQRRPPRRGQGSLSGLPARGPRRRQPPRRPADTGSTARQRRHGLVRQVRRIHRPPPDPRTTRPLPGGPPPARRRHHAAR
ncbi:hypothetical protein ACFRKD_08195 [Streptomyces niveus]|uniref:hypothetical protein n=1 Tax=Streptomyces niveus TaxID=193462 RepID=UPI0036A14621